MKPQLKYLSDAEIKEIHHYAIRILDEIGMRMPHKDAIRILKQAGAKIVDNDTVKIPEHLIQDALATVPKRESFILYGRDPKHDVSFKKHKPTLSCMTMAVNVIDPYSRKKRSATEKDLADLTRIADQLEHVGIAGGLVTPQEVPGEYNDWYTWAGTLKNTTKHITGGMLGARCVRDAAKMASIAVESETLFNERPYISGWVLTLPPLGIDIESLDALMEMNRRNISSIVSSGPILGVSSPVTIPGTLVQAHAEIMACIVLSQLINPGAPIVYTSFARGVDMRTGNISMACPEFGVLKGCMAQMGRFLELPVRMPSMLRDSKLLDAQAGFETGMIGTTTGFVADIMDSMQLDMDLVVEYPDLLFCNDCMAAIKRMMRELTINDEMLAIETIKSVGPGGSYLASAHTFKHFRNELWNPDLIERRNWDKWELDGSLSIFEVAEKKVLEMLKSHPGKILTNEAESAIDQVVLDAQK
jgi:trimethylamine---corrinoid protein Co-methyltransferase